MKDLILMAALLVTLGAPSPVIAGKPYEALDAGDVFVATITRVEDQGATSAHPPRVWLEIHEVIRGEAEVARSPAIWNPRYHSYDTSGLEKEIERWNAVPLPGPKVGQKFILGGRFWERAPDKQGPDKEGTAEKELRDYHLFSFVRIPYSDQARGRTIQTLTALNAARRKYAVDQAAAVRDRELRGKTWRAAMDDQIIDQRTQEAEAVAIVREVSGWTYEIETMLKGHPWMLVGGRHYISLVAKNYDPRIADLLFMQPRYILFLSENHLPDALTSFDAQIVDPYEGIVVADSAAISAVKASLNKRPAPEPLPVLVISAAEKEDAASLAQDARASFTVVNFRQYFSDESYTTAEVLKTIPDAAFLVMIRRAPLRNVVAMQIGLDSVTLLYKDTWPDLDAAEQVEALTKVLVEKAK